MNRESLVNAGINYDEGVNRFANKPQIYEKYLAKMFDNAEIMEQLHSQLEAGNYDAAFRAAHDLKGMSGNLSMNAFYDAICALVEQLRSGCPTEDVEALFRQANDLYELAKKAVKG